MLPGLVGLESIPGDKDDGHSSGVTGAEEPPAAACGTSAGDPFGEIPMGPSLDRNAAVVVSLVCADGPQADERHGVVHVPGAEVGVGVFEAVADNGW